MYCGARNARYFSLYNKNFLGTSFLQKRKYRGVFCLIKIILILLNKNIKIRTDNIMEVTQKELADILGITARRVRQLRDEEKIFVYTDDSKSKRYDLKKCVQNYIKFKSTGGNQYRDIREKTK